MQGLRPGRARIRTRRPTSSWRSRSNSADRWWARQAFDELIAVTDKNGAVVKGSWVLSDDAQGRCASRTSKRARTTSSRSRPASPPPTATASARKLSKQVYTGPLEPVVGFASQGSVLPARESRGLPVVSVNVPEVDVEFLRVARQGPAAVLRRVPARRSPRQLGTGQRLQREDAAGATRRTGLREPLRARRQAERARADLPAAAGHRGAAAAGPVLRGDEARRASSRTSSRPRSSPSATSACTRAPTRTSCSCTRPRCEAATPVGGVELKVLDAKGEVGAEGRDRRQRQRAARLQARRRARAGRHARQRRVDAAVQPAGAGPVRIRGQRAASRRGSTCSPGRAATCTARAKPCACRRCCATRTASRSRPRARRCSRCSCATCSPTARPSSKRGCNPTRRATCATSR